MAYSKTNILSHPSFDQFICTQLVPLRWVSEGWLKHSSEAPLSGRRICLQIHSGCCYNPVPHGYGAEFPMLSPAVSWEPLQRFKAACTPQDAMVSIFRLARVHQVPHASHL